MRKSECAQLVAELIALFPHAKVSESTSAAYEMHLADLPYESCRQAVNRLAGTARFFPTVAEVRAAAADLRVGPLRTGLEAYQLAVSAAQRHGWCSPPRWRDPRIVKAIEMCGGWVEFCKTPADAAERVRFAELYDTLAARERADTVSGVPLPETAPTEKQLR